MVPARAFSASRDLLNGELISDSLDLTPRYVSDSASSLPYMLASVLTEVEAERAEQRMLELTKLSTDRLWEIVGPPVAEFVEHLAYDKVVPFEESPLSLASLATIANAGTKAGAVGIGFAVGLVAGYGSAFVLVTVPAGIILCGAAIAVAKALQEGLTPRLTSLIKGEPMKRSRPRTPKEKIVASVQHHMSEKSSEGKH